MPRLLLRAAKDPFLALTPEAVMARNVIGSNSGNLLFSEAVYKALAVPGTEIIANGYLTERGVSDRHVARINEEFDAFVVPLANAFRPDFISSLTRLTEVIEQLRIPVVIVGVGAQVSTTGLELQPEVQDATRRFLRAVLDRSAQVGVRGEITARCLKALGFGAEHVEVIGCPSLFFDGPDLSVSRSDEPLTPDSPLAVNLTPTRPRMTAILNANLARYSRLTYVPQERRELGLLLWGEEPPEYAQDPSVPMRRDHPALSSGRTAFFVDPATWRSFMRQQRFAFGTRIHGTIAALAAGTPAHVLTFDSRTLELADYHNIPHLPLRDVAQDVDAAELYERSDMAAFNRGHAETAARYLRFLEHNGLNHVFREGGDPREFDRRLAEVNFPGPVTPMQNGSPDLARQVQERLSWLRQGNAVDAERRHGAFVPVFGPRPNSPTLAQVDQRLRTLSEDVQRLEQVVRRTNAATHAASGPTKAPVGGVPRSVRRVLGRVKRATKGRLSRVLARPAPAPDEQRRAPAAARR